MKALILGAGSRPDRTITVNGRSTWDGYEVVRLDYNSDHSPDIVANLEALPYSWAPDNEYDEIHAYEVLEHTGQQGDWRFFFDQFSELWRILKPGGIIAATVPRWDSMWAWGDPSHKRVISPGTLAFLSQEQYEKQVGRTSMSDFRFCYKADLRVVMSQNSGESFVFALRAVKP